MTVRVFVPMTDDMLEMSDAGAVPLVPYHPDRPCLRLDPAAERPPVSRADTGAGAARAAPPGRGPAH